MTRKSAWEALFGELGKLLKDDSTPRKAFCYLFNKGYVIAWHDESDRIVIRTPRNLPKIPKSTAIMLKEELGINSRKALENLKGECQQDF